MFARKRFTWKQQVQLKSGRVYDETVSSYWSPEHPTTKDAVAVTAKVQAQERHKTEAVAVGQPVLSG